MNAHTPGPWYTEATSAIGHHFVIDGDGFTICNPSPMGAGNARLIAAAPELLAALQWIAEHPAEYGDIEDSETMLAHIVDKARAAIAKATGGAPVSANTPDDSIDFWADADETEKHYGGEA